MMKKRYYFLLAFLGIIAIVFFMGMGNSKLELVNDFSGEMKIYKTPTCGCCTLYSNYYRSQGNKGMEALTVSENELNKIKEDLGIPVALWSCHTTIVGDYFIEGHIPLEVIEILLEKKPNVAGIALPGMPVGSPGMPGRKASEFIVYGVNFDGTYQEFVRY